MGHNVYVFTMNDGNLKTRELIGGVEVHRPLLMDITGVMFDIVASELKNWGPGFKFFSDIYLYNLLSASKLINDLHRFEGYRFDIVSVHDWLSVISGLLVKKHLAIPMVFHVHSTERGRTLGNGSMTVMELERKGAYGADRIVTVSYAMRSELETLGFPVDRVDVVYNGVDPDRYDPGRVGREEVYRLREKYGLKEDEKIILFIGRLTAVKGIDKLIQAMPYILAKHPEARLIVVGLGELKDYLVNLTKNLGLEGKVILRFEFLNDDERILHYAMSDICVFPSLYEPFGIVSVEAMSMAKPVVVGAAGISGMREIVIPSGENQTGIHVDPKRPEDIAWGVNLLLDDPRLAEKLGVNGRRRVLEEFTWDRIAERTIKIYEKLTKT
jgi:glycosyltransferase involved in cell wall biosynthesis